MDTMWEIWSYVNLVIVILMLCFAFAWRAQRGKSLFCVYGVMVVVFSALSIVWRLLLNRNVLEYGHPVMLVFTVFLLIGAIAQGILLFVFVLVVWSGGRSGTGLTEAGSQVERRVEAVVTGSTEIGPPISGIKRAHYGLWITLVILSYVLSISGFALVFIGEDSYEEGLVILGGLLCAVGAGLSIWLTVLSCIYVYRMWRMLPGSYARTTPGKAVGFCFIPFFNFYWFFVAVHGWSKDYNRFIGETGRTHIDRTPEGLFLAMCILTVVGAIPFINYVLAIPNVIIWMVVFYYICRAINAMADECARKDVASNAVAERNDS